MFTIAKLTMIKQVSASLVKPKTNRKHYYAFQVILDCDEAEDFPRKSVLRLYSAKLISNGVEIPVLILSPVDLPLSRNAEA